MASLCARFVSAHGSGQGGQGLLVVRVVHGSRASGPTLGHFEPPSPNLRFKGCLLKMKSMIADRMRVEAYETAIDRQERGQRANESRGPATATRSRRERLQQKGPWTPAVNRTIQE